MDLHEYQAKEILKRYGVTIPPFWIVTTVEEAQKLVEQQGLEAAVLKIQVHAGGRGKAGGVKIAKSREAIIKEAEKLLGMKMVNQQTGPRGLISSKLLLTVPIKIKKEAYLALSIDRHLGAIVLIASQSGGMEIEEVAQTHPEKIFSLSLPKDGIFRQYQLFELAKQMDWKGNLAKEGADLVCKLVKCFIENDALLLEVNPLVETDEGKLLTLDAKMTIDDNALFRHSQLKQLFDPTQLTEEERRAQEHELAYVALEGNIGCIVNGAGLAMATMDLISYAGGKAANFLDVGGGASKEKIAEGFKIVLSDPNVKAILVNIFGGIMNCETLAEGILAAAQECQITVPIVIRMEGTNVEQGRALIKNSRFHFEIAKDLSEAAEKVVRLAKSEASCQF